MEKKKIDFLEKIFLLSVVIDITTLSLISILLITVFVGIVFIGFLVCMVGGTVLLKEILSASLNIGIFAGLGFLGTSIAYFLASFALAIILIKLILSYPRIIRRLKNFVSSKEENIAPKEEKNIEKHIVHLMIVLIVIAIISIFISILMNQFQYVLTFLQSNFSFQTIIEGGKGI